MRFTATCVLAFMLLSGSVLAHVPYVEECEHGDYTVDRPFEIPSPIEHSRALFAYLDSASDVDVVRFTLTDQDVGRSFHFGSLVPACDAYENALLRVALVGPAQPSLPPYDGTVELPFEPSAQQGVYLIDNEEQGPRWYEFFTAKWYFYQETVDLPLTESGDYQLYYWAVDGAVTDYVAEIGDVEHWGTAEILRALWYEGYLLHDFELHDLWCAIQL